MRKLAEWLRGYRPDLATVAAGAGVDLSPLLAGIIGDILLHNLLGNVLLPGIGLVASAAFAKLRAERNKDTTREQIISDLFQRRRELILDQRMKLGRNVEEAFERLSDPISKSIAAEIDVLDRNMTDLLQRREQASFDAEAFENSLLSFEAAVKTDVWAIRKLAGL